MRGTRLLLGDGPRSSLSPSLSSLSRSRSALFCQSFNTITGLLHNFQVSRNSKGAVTLRARTFIFLRCFIFGTFLLAGRTILSALIHSSYLRTNTKNKRQFHKAALCDGAKKHSLTPPTTHRHLYCLTPTCCCDTISLNSKQRNPVVLCGKDKPFTMRKEIFKTNHHTNHILQSPNSTKGATWVVWRK